MEAPSYSERPIISSPSDDKIDNIEAIKFGWEAMKEHFWLFMGIGLTAIGIYGIEWLIQLGARGHSLVSFFMQLAFFYLNLVIFALGYRKVCLKMVDGEATEFGDLFSCFHKGWTMILACIILGLMFIPVGILAVIFAVMIKKAAFAGIIGMIALIIAFSIFILRFTFITYLVVDKEMGPMECIKANWNMTKGTIWDLSMFFLLLGLVILAGALCLGVGLIAAMPTVSVATAYYYRQLSKRL